MFCGLTFRLTLLFVVTLALHNLLGNNINDGIVDHNPKSCIVCVPELGNVSDAESGEDFQPHKKVSVSGSSAEK